MFNSIKYMEITKNILGNGSGTIKAFVSFILKSYNGTLPTCTNPDKIKQGSHKRYDGPY